MALKNFGQRLRATREARGFSQADLAREIGLTGPSILLMENGTTKQTKHLLAIAKVLDVNPNWLQDGGEPEPDFLRNEEGTTGAQRALDVRLLGPLNVSYVDVIGVASVGVWTPRSDIKRRGVVMMPPHPIFEKASAFKVIDDHTDRLDRPIPKDSFAVVAPYAELPIKEPRHGDAVLAEIYRDDDTIQHTIREFIEDESGARAVTNSSRPELMLSTEYKNGKLVNGEIRCRCIGTAMIYPDVQAMLSAGR